MLNKQQKQRGGMILGIIIGVLIGLGGALAVAMYVMKVPTPFNSKSTSRTQAQDSAEAKKNKDWDPNAALSSKPAVKPPAEGTTSATTPAPLSAPPPAAGESTGIDYYVQVGAYRSEDEAKAMRAKLALSGFEGKIIDREQSGNKVFRVRVGPYPNTAAGDKAKAGLEAAGFETIVVRSQK
jgi:cell division protein FtsN